MSKSRGFTLIELLVTISIIAILATIGLVAYSSVMKQGRDSKRQSDLRSIQSALEQYYADQFFYPSPIFSLYLVTGGAFTSAVGIPPPPPPFVKTYMNSLPKDPKDAPKAPVYYTYKAIIPPNLPCDNSKPATKCTSYCLYAKLENPPSPIPSPPPGCDPYPPGGYNFAVTPPP